MSEKKICPLMSAPVFNKSHQAYAMKHAPCKGSECAFWTTVYTTEQHQVSGCCYEIQPHIHEGLYRV